MKISTVALPLFFALVASVAIAKQPVELYQENDEWYLRLDMTLPDGADRSATLRARAGASDALLAEVCRIGTSSNSCSVQYAMPRPVGNTMLLRLRGVLVNGKPLSEEQLFRYTK